MQFLRMIRPIMEKRTYKQSCMLLKIEISLVLINLLAFQNLLKNLKRPFEENFEDSENRFFDVIIYGVMFYKSNGEIIDKTKIVEVLGEDFYNDLLEIKDDIKLDKTLFGYFDRCFIINQVLAKHFFFLKFFD